MHELSRTHNPITRRAPDIGCLVHREESPFPRGSTRPYYLYGRQRRIKSRHRQKSAHFTTYCSTMAATVLISTPPRTGKRRSSPRPKAENSSTQNRCGCRCHIAQQAVQCDPLEYAKHGRGSRPQSICRDTHLAETQPKTAPCRNIQTQPRQAIQRKASRCGRSLSQPSGQGLGSLRRREESNTGSRSNSPHNAITSGYPRTSDSRLYAARHHNLIRGVKHARRQSHRRLHAATPPSRIHPVPAIDQCQNAVGFGLASHCRQLWHAQTCSRKVMAEAPSSVPFAFHSNIQFVAQHGRTLVSRDYRQTYSSRFVQERSRPHQRDYEISREPQPKSARFYLERIG